MSNFDKFAWMKAAEGFKMGPTDRCVMLHIYNKTNGNGTNAYVSEIGLSEKFGKSTRQVRRAIKLLTGYGLIHQTHKGSKDGANFSTYRLTMPPKPDTVSGSKPDIKPDMVGEQIGHEEQTGHVVSEQTGHGVSGTPDPLTRSCKGSGSKEPDLPDMTMSGVDASLAVDEEPEGSSQPSGAASNPSTAESRKARWEDYLPKESDSYESDSEPDTDVSGINRTSLMSGVDPETSTESEAMRNDPFDPWAAGPARENEYQRSAAARFNLGQRWTGWTVVPWPDNKMPPRKGQPGYAGPRAVFVGKTSGELIGVSPFEIEEPVSVSNTFVGPDTDPATGGPDWDQGPRQMPA